MLLRSLVIILLSILITTCGRNTDSIYSLDEKHRFTVLSKIESNGKSYTYIRYEKETDSSEFALLGTVRARNKYTDAWYCMVLWQDSLLKIYQPYKDFEDVSYTLGQKVELIQMKDEDFFNTFFSDDITSYITMV